jgi:hypothetical protein
MRVDVGWVGGDGLTTVKSSTDFQADVTNMSTLTTANQLDVGSIAGSTVSTATAQIGVNVIEIASGSATAMTISTATEYDGMDHGTLMKYLQSYAIGDFGVTGASTNVVVYDDFSGSTLMAHTFTTKTRSWSS